MRRGGRIVSTAIIIAIGVNGDGRREVLRLDICPSEADTFWGEFLRKLARRGLRGVKLVISDAHAWTERSRSSESALTMPWNTHQDGGWGFAVSNEHGRPLFSLTYATKAEAEEAHGLMAMVIARAEVTPHA